MNIAPMIALCTTTSVLLLLLFIVDNSDAAIAWNRNQGEYCKGANHQTVMCEDMGPVNPLDELATHHGTDKASNLHGYTLIYEPVFQHFRNKRIVLLEIGCYRGQSMMMWADYFPEGTIACIDLHPHAVKTKDMNDRVKVFIANQGNETELHEVMARLGEAPDIIIDDGSHLARHIITSYKTLYPYLKMDGVYLIEDLTTQHSPTYAGNGCNGETAFDFVRDLMKYVMMTVVCDTPRNPWEMNIKDVHVYGAGGLAVIHKGEWNRYDGERAQWTWSPQLRFGPEAAVPARFGGNDQQFLAWDNEKIEEDIVQRASEEEMLVTNEKF